MHPSLQAAYDLTVALYRDDPRVPGAWEYGSRGKGTDDQYSDVDPVFMIRDEDFDAVDRELRPLFESFSAHISLWWPEGMNSADIRNYAILYAPREDPGTLLQYDMTIAKVKSVKDGFGKFMLTGCGQVEVLFDKTGLLGSILVESPPQRQTADKLVWLIERYWVYVYIHVKYLRRGDVFKMLYAQQTLFQNHLDVLKALYPDGFWGWWPWSVKNVLPKDKQNGLLLYWGAIDRDAVAAALVRELDVFSADARAACALWGLAYPESVEADVRAYLAKQILSTNSKSVC